MIKNTGHDQSVAKIIVESSTDPDSLGRSSGEDAFVIWTHNIKGRKWHDSFVPKNAPRNSAGIPAATLQAGEQWLGTLHRLVFI